MKYIMDVDALKKCLMLLSKPYSVNGNSCVYLEHVLELLDSFPKDALDDMVIQEI